MTFSISVERVYKYVTVVKQVPTRNFETSETRKFKDLQQIFPNFSGVSLYLNPYPNIY